MKNLLIAFIFFITFSGCNISEYSPNQKFNNTTATNVNAKQILKLPHKPIGAPIRIAVSGDTQRKYHEAQQFVDHINARNDIDFVFLNGDISDFGLLLEFDGIFNIYSKLKVPFISIIGNHDHLANGDDVYKRMFGEFNFAFKYAGIKFVCHDSNSREHKFDGTVPDLDWLKKNLTLDSGVTNMIAISHVPPTDFDFDPALRNRYETLFNNTPKMLASIHSHQHSEDLIYKQDGSGITFLTTNAVVNRAYTIINIKDAKFTAEAVHF